MFSTGPARTLGVGLVFCAAVFTFHWRVLFSSKYQIPWDLPGYHLPLATAYADSLAEGTAPVWDPYGYCGRPLLANPQAMVFYPGMFLAVAFGRDQLQRRLEILAVLHILIAGWLAYLLSFRLNRSVAASFVAGLMFCLGAFPASQIEHLGLICGMPWLVLAWLALTLPYRWQFFTLSCAFGGAALAGFTPFTIAVVVSTVLMSTVLRISLRHAPSPVTVLLAALTGAMIAGVQLAPSLQLASLSVAKYRWEWLNGGLSIHPKALLSLVIPNVYGVFDPATYREPFDLTHMYLFSSITGLVCAGLAVCRRPRSLSVAMAVAGAVFCLLMSGAYTPAGRLLFAALPHFAQNSVYWFPFMAPFLLSLSLLAGEGAARLGKRWGLPWAAALLVAVECIAISSGRPMNSQLIRDSWPVTESAIDGDATVVRELKGLAAGLRFDTLDDSPQTVMGAPILCLRTGGGYDPMALERLIQVRLACAKGERWGAFYQVEDGGSRAIALMSVGALVGRASIPDESLSKWRLKRAASVPGRTIYTTEQALPRYRLVGHVRSARSMEDAVQYVKSASIDPSMDAVAEGYALHSTPCAGSVNILTEDRQRVVLRTDCLSASYLVTSEAHFPGWVAFVDGTRVKIYYTNVAFRGLPVPPGRHEIVMEFRPTIVLVGAAVSIIGIAAVLLSL